MKLPEPVKKYIRYAGSVGKPKVNNFRIEFVGKLRKNEQSEWMPFTSDQYNFMDTSTRLFFMKAVMKHLPVCRFTIVLRTALRLWTSGCSHCSKSNVESEKKWMLPRR